MDRRNQVYWRERKRKVGKDDPSLVLETVRNVVLPPSPSQNPEREQEAQESLHVFHDDRVREKNLSRGG